MAFGPPDLLAIVVLALFGASVGSFLNVVVTRLPDAAGRELARRLIGPRSACPACGRTIPAQENIPLVSYVFLRGRCRGCGNTIPSRYPVVEALGAFAAIGCVWRFGVGAEALAAFVFAAFGLAIAAIDVERFMIPDFLSVPLLVIGLAVNALGLFVPLQEAAIGAALGYASLWLVRRGFHALTGKDAMGVGDLKLFAAIGAWLGWTLLPAVLFLASLAGCLVGLALRFSGRLEAGGPMPFGPFLVVAGIAGFLWGGVFSALYGSGAVP